MTLSHRLSRWQILGLSLVMGLLIGSSDTVWSQGLSGVPQRLDETVGRNGQDPGGYDDSDMEGYDDDGEDGYDDLDMEGYDDSDMEGYDDSYDGMSGGGGSRGPAGPPASDAVRTYGENLISLMGEIDLNPLFAASDATKIEVGPVLSREAEQAYQSGNHGLALELMFGHMAAEYEDAAVKLKTVKYSKLLRRPVWTVRWGVSMAVRGEDITDPKPIREGATPLRSLARGGGGGGGGGYEDEMEMEMEGGGYEDEMEEEMGDMEEEMMAEMMGGRRPPRAANAAPELPDRKMLSDEADASMQKMLGLVATVVAEKFNERLQGGDYGPVLNSVTPSEAGPIAMSGALSDSLAEANATPMWKPGLAYLGMVDSYKEALPIAKSASVDLLLHFDVSVKKLRNDGVQNTSRARLIHVPSGKSLVVSGAMDTNEAANLASAGRMGEREYVEQQLEKLLMVVDRDVKVSELPRLTPAAATKRIASILSGPNYRTLRTLAEIRLFQIQGLINEQQVEEAFDIVGGSEGLTLLHGTVDDRINTARKWAVASQGSEN